MTYAVPFLSCFGACSAAWLGDVAWPWVAMTLLGLFAVMADELEAAVDMDELP